MLTQKRLKEILHYDPLTGVFRWAVDVGRRLKAGARAGSLNTAGYLRITIDGKSYRANRLAFLYMVGSWPLQLSDHENRNKKDNSWENLREASFGQNRANCIGHGVSGLKGAHWDARKRVFRSSISNVHLGYFGPCAPSAHFAYIVAADKAFGEFARAA